MSKLRPPTRVRFDAIASDVGVLRLSTCLRRLRAAGEKVAAQVVQDLYEKCGNECLVHGHLDDPIVLTAGKEDVAFGCPWCSGPDVLAAWEKEGAN